MGGDFRIVDSSDWSLILGEIALEKYLCLGLKTAA